MTFNVGNSEIETKQDVIKILELANAEIANGRPVEALKSVAILMTAHSSDTRVITAAYHALSNAVIDQKSLAVWRDAEKYECYQQLLLQTECPTRPLILHHGIASLLTSNNISTARAIVVELQPVVEDILQVELPPKELVLYFLVVRSILDGLLSQDKISGWHKTYFPEFEPKDLELPYSTIFNAEQFGANRDDLQRMFPDRNAALDPNLNLGLSHILLLEWLTGKDFFVDQDNCDLLSVLDRWLNSINAPHYEKQAARSLVLRHWRNGSVITDTVAETLDISNSLSAVSNIKDRLEQASVPTQTGAHYLNSRAYQAVQLTKSIAARAIPVLNRGQRRVRVAICVSGQLRGFRAALETWRRSILATIDCDIYVHCWATVGRAGAQPFRADLPFEGENFCTEWRHLGMIQGYEAMLQRYPSLFDSLATSAYVDLDELTAEYSIGTKTAKVVIEDETDQRFCEFTNQDKMHYKIYAANELTVNVTKQYDLVMRIRPDLSVDFSAFDWRDLRDACQAEPILFCDHAFGVHYGQPMIGDQIAVGAPDVMAVYANTWRKYSRFSNLDLAWYPVNLTGHVSLAQICWLHGIKVHRIPVKLGRLLDPEPLSHGAIRDAISKDMADRNDKIDQALLAAIDRDFG